MLEATERQLVLLAILVSTSAALGAFLLTNQANSDESGCRPIANDLEHRKETMGVNDSKKLVATDSLGTDSPFERPLDPHYDRATGHGQKPVDSPTTVELVEHARTVERARFVFDGTPQPELETWSEDAMIESVNRVLIELGMRPITTAPDLIETTRGGDKSRNLLLQWYDYSAFGALRVTVFDCESRDAMRCIRSVEVQPRRKLDVFLGPEEKKDTPLTYRYCRKGLRFEASLCEPPRRRTLFFEALPVQTRGVEWTDSWKHDLRSVVRRRSSAIRNCYERVLRQNPDARGEVRFDVTIGQRGHVINVESVRDIDGGNVANCGARALKRWRFPRPDAPTSALLGFRLSPNPGSTE
jgi:hypothetical protein